MTNILSITVKRRFLLFTLSVLCALAFMPTHSQSDESTRKSIYAKDNLVAWCIVPFDAKKRGPVQRAEMLKRLGIKKLAYDWRQEHVPTFEKEILELKKHGIEFFAFWSVHEKAFQLFQKHGIKPQIWMTLREAGGNSQKEKVESAARRLLPLVKRTQGLGCKLGLYNHGGWGGEPRNLVAVCSWLRKNAQADHVGIVYNFHHGHDHMHDFEKSLAMMKPYLLCINLNGMNDGANPKILPLGKGRHEQAMMQVILSSGYNGPIAILDHRGNVDAVKCLSENLGGMKSLLKQMGDTAALKTYE